jgi:hypothetical protein
MVADEATGGGTQHAMMPNKVTDNAADQGPFEAPSRFGGRCRAADCRDDGDASKHVFHEKNSCDPLIV